MCHNIKNVSIKLCYPVETIFDTIINSVTDIKTDNIKYPDSIFYFNNNNCIAKYNKKNGYFWCNHNRFWSKFYLNNAFNYYTVRCLLSSIVEEHFKLSGVTTCYPTTIGCCAVEKHFK